MFNQSFVTTNQKWFRNHQTLVVDKAGGGDFNTLMDALNLSLNDPATSYFIMVAASTSDYEEVNLPMPSNTTIWGSSPATVTIGGAGTGGGGDSTFKATANVSSFYIYNCQLLDSNDSTLIDANGFTFDTATEMSVMIINSVVNTGTIDNNSGAVKFANCNIRGSWNESEIVGSHLTSPNKQVTASVYWGGSTGFDAEFAGVKFKLATEIQSSNLITNSHFGVDATGTVPVTASDRTDGSKIILSYAGKIVIPPNWLAGSNPLSAYMCYADEIEAPAASTKSPEIAFGFTEILTNPLNVSLPFNRIPYRWRAAHRDITPLIVRAIITQRADLMQWNDNSNITIAKITSDGQLSSSGIAQPRRTVVATTTGLNTDYLIRCDTSGGAFSFNLPDTSTVLPGKILVVKNIGSNILSIGAFSTEKIDGQLTDSIPVLNDSMTFIENGVDGWDII